MTIFSYGESYSNSTGGSIAVRSNNPCVVVGLSKTDDGLEITSLSAYDENQAFYVPNLGLSLIFSAVSLQLDSLMGYLRDQTCYNYKTNELYSTTSRFDALGDLAKRTNTALFTKTTDSSGNFQSWNAVYKFYVRNQTNKTVRFAFEYAVSTGWRNTYTVAPGAIIEIGQQLSQDIAFIQEPQIMRFAYDPEGGSDFAYYDGVFELYFVVNAVTSLSQDNPLPRLNKADVMYGTHTAYFTATQDSIVTQILNGLVLFVGYLDIKSLDR